MCLLSSFTVVSLFISTRLHFSSCLISFLAPCQHDSSFVQFTLPAILCFLLLPPYRLITSSDLVLLTPFIFCLNFRGGDLEGDWGDGPQKFELRGTVHASVVPPIFFRSI